MTVKQWRQRTAIVGIEAFPQAIPFNGTLDQNCVYLCRNGVWGRGCLQAYNPAFRGSGR
jgi:hypothetical protein